MTVPNWEDPFWERDKESPFDLSSVLFKQQLPFGLDEARHQTAVTPRRAGKSYAIAAKLLSAARKRPGCVCLYITKSRLNAKRILWRILKGLNTEHSLGGVPKEGELCLEMLNGARIYLSGAAHEEEVENYRGLPIALAVIDEAQSFPSYIEKLVDEVLVPALTDYAGTLALVGTPGPVPVGYFHSATQNAKWTHHNWSVFDNIHLAAKSGRSTQSLLNEELERRGVSIEDPVIQREWFGRWVLDTNSLVFRYDPAINARKPKEHQHHVIGFDLGFDDADAIAVLGWSDNSPDLDLVYESIKTKQTLTPLAKELQVLYDRYQPLAMVGDFGGLGKKIAAELTERTGLPLEAAEKERKLEHIELLNDSLRTGHFFAPADSRFAQDCQLVEFDRSNPEKPKISSRYHSDIADAALYAHRKCLQWLFVPPKQPAAPRGTPEWHAEQQKAAQAEILESFESQMEANAQSEREQRDLEQW